MNVRAAALALLWAAVAAASLPAAAGSAVQPRATTWWRPQRYTSSGSFTRFQYQLSDSGTITYVKGVQVYAIDFDTAQSAIPLLRAKDANIKVICYFSAGSWESYRVDEDLIKRGIQSSAWNGALGAEMDGWPDERWVDVRTQAVRDIMIKRLDYCQRIGCNGVDPDNVNGHSQPEGATGLSPPLQRSDLVAYMKFLADEAHKRGMGIGLKNGMDMVPELEPLMDWALNEECFTFSECDAYQAFNKSKPIWGIEYCNAYAAFGAPTQDPACFCPRAKRQGLNFIFKYVNLGAAGISCTQYCSLYKCGSATASTSCKASKNNMCGVVPSTPKL